MNFSFDCGAARPVLRLEVAEVGPVASGVRPGRFALGLVFATERPARAHRF